MSDTRKVLSEALARAMSGLPFNLESVVDAIDARIKRLILEHVMHEKGIDPRAAPESSAAKTPSEPGQQTTCPRCLESLVFTTTYSAGHWRFVGRDERHTDLACAERCAVNAERNLKALYAIGEVLGLPAMSDPPHVAVVRAVREYVAAHTNTVEVDGVVYGANMIRELRERAGFRCTCGFGKTSFLHDPSCPCSPSRTAMPSKTAQHALAQVMSGPLREALNVIMGRILPIKSDEPDSMSRRVRAELADRITQFHQAAVELTSALSGYESLYERLPDRGEPGIAPTEPRPPAFTEEPKSAAHRKRARDIVPGIPRNMHYLIAERYPTDASTRYWNVGAGDWGAHEDATVFQGHSGEPVVASLRNEARKTATLVRFEENAPADKPRAGWVCRALCGWSDTSDLTERFDSDVCPQCAAPIAMVDPRAPEEIVVEVEDDRRTGHTCVTGRAWSIGDPAQNSSTKWRLRYVSLAHHYEERRQRALAENGLASEKGAYASLAESFQKEQSKNIELMKRLVTLQGGDSSSTSFDLGLAYVALDWQKGDDRTHGALGKAMMAYLKRNRERVIAELARDSVPANGSEWERRCAAISDILGRQSGESHVDAARRVMNGIEEAIRISQDLITWGHVGDTPAGPVIEAKNRLDALKKKVGWSK